MSDFFQDGPKLGNQYDDDRLLRSYLKRKLGGELLKELEPGLKRLGLRAITDIQALGDAAEAQQPQHVPFDPWGRRIDRIEVPRAWEELDRISAEERLVATAYERKEGELSRVHQFARVYLFGPASAVYTCPLAMTDGAARAIELYGDDHLKENAFRHLTSSDPKNFWTSGQWMTERTGGSDVSQTSTVAKPRPGKNGEYLLSGEKWFTSAISSQMAMTLARIEGAPAGNKGLSLFYLKLRDQDGMLNGIQVHRLKDKLGTRALPTAELTLEGTPAVLVGEAGHGVRKIASLFNITRIWNGLCAIGLMRRGLALARDYSSRRQAFGHLLIDLPAHRQTLAGLECEFEGAFHLMFRLAELLGRDETSKATPAESAALRLLTPVAKLYTAKQSIEVASEVLECFGGAGYLEDTGLPRLLRDSQVLAIWEGTTNVLSLDALRAIKKENALEPFLAEIASQIAGVQNAELEPLVMIVKAALGRISKFASEFSSLSSEVIQSGARAFAFSLARTYEAALLIAHANWAVTTSESSAPATVAAARRFCRRDLVDSGMENMVSGIYLKDADVLLS